MLYDVGCFLGGDEDIHSLRRSQKRLQSDWAGARELTDHRFSGAVDQWLRQHRGMLIGEVVPLALESLQSGDIPRGAFDEVILDEYQDLTASEQSMVELMWSGARSFVVLGDNDQSIYRFRFNHPEGIEGFGTGRAELEDISIPENRRCGREIVGIANILMAEAGSTKPPMEASRECEGSVSLVYWPSLADEIAGLATYIGERSEVAFLVLVPRRFVGYRLQEAIGSESRTSFYQEVLQYPITQERFMIASILADPDDRIAVRAWLGLKAEGAAYAQKRNAVCCQSFASESARGLGLARGIADGSIVVKGQGRSAVISRAQEICGIYDSAPAEDEDRIALAFDPAVADREPDEERRERTRSDLETLRNAGLQILAEASPTAMTQVMERLRYRIATRTPLVDEPPARVRIMTLHSAKGLEGDVIVVAGLADQMIPGFEVGEGREEQRRLLYVAVTRAREELVLSWSRAVPYGEAKGNNVRIDRVIHEGGETLAKLSKTSFLPASLPTLRRGTSWLAGVVGSHPAPDRRRSPDDSADSG